MQFMAPSAPKRLSKWLILLLAISPLPFNNRAIAGQLKYPLRSHGPIQVLRDEKGKPLRVNETSAASINWAGYVLPKFETGVTYTSASATWSIPTVLFDPEDNFLGVTAEFSSNWLGIGGYCTNTSCSKVDSKLIQLGTEHDVAIDGSTEYYAWYEILPSAAVAIPTLSINPGDTVTATISCAGKCSGKASWTLTLNDATSGTNWRHTFKYTGSKLSIEWILEAPYGYELSKKPSVLPLADFNTASFSSSMVNGIPADLSKGDNIVMFDNSNYGSKNNIDWGQTANISTANSTLDGFNVCWGSNDILTTPCNSD